MSEYYPICLKMENNGGKILDSPGKVTVSNNVDYPRFDYGFHHWIHQNKNSTNILEQFKNKKKVYYVMHEFEKNIEKLIYAGYKPQPRPRGKY